jgi:CcmD family protein
MKRARASLLVVVVALCVNAAAFAYQPPAAQGDYLPVTSSPAAVESLPAAPFLITAYVFVWVALLGYLWFLWGRMKKVQHELESLERRASQRDGGK